MEAILELFDAIAGTLEQLAALGRKKAAAVQADDLIALNEVLKQEQALSLSVRGLEQKRTELLSRFDLLDTPLMQAHEKFPPELRLRAKSAAEQLQREYEVYRSAAEVARDTLECNLHEIEKFLANAGVDAAPGTGYSSPAVDLPASLKTDFHA